MSFFSALLKQLLENGNALWVEFNENIIYGSRQYFIVLVNVRKLKCTLT